MPAPHVADNDEKVLLPLVQADATYRLEWAVLECGRCHGRMRVLAVIKATSDSCA